MENHRFRGVPHKETHLDSIFRGLRFPLPQPAPKSTDSITPAERSCSPTAKRTKIQGPREIGSCPVKTQKEGGSLHTGRVTGIHLAGERVGCQLLVINGSNMFEVLYPGPSAHGNDADISEKNWTLDGAPSVWGSCHA